MDTYPDSGAEKAGQTCHELPEVIGVRRNMYVRDWKADKLHSNLTGYRAFLRKTE